MTPDICPGCDDACPGRGHPRYCRLWRAHRVARMTPAEVVASLTDAQRAELAGCPHREEKTSCCGPRTACRTYGRIRSNATATEDCARCLVSRLDRS